MIKEVVAVAVRKFVVVVLVGKYWGEFWGMEGKLTHSFSLPLSLARTLLRLLCLMRAESK